MMHVEIVSNISKTKYIIIGVEHILCFFITIFLTYSDSVILIS